MPTNEPPAQWTSPPGPPPAQRRSRGCLWGCAGAAAVVVIVVVVLVIALGGGDGTGREPRGNGERADLVSFRLDDRSEAGVTSIWITWTIKNSSSEKSDYSWDWEAVDADGTRLENGSQPETDVQPGQTTRGEYPTTLKSTKGVKLNITSFDRTAGH
ncbi:hypothetical protein [Streptomyces sp. WAC 04229]|uniref:hypothetical protein n=1 Tax=Streptomyces sp. WAC 04229 TaxID=2203206 RepID=UPI003D76333E